MKPRPASLAGSALAAPNQSLFFAVLPDAAARAAIARLADALWREHGLHGRRIDPARYHLTLHYLGASPGSRPELETLASDAARTVRAEGFDMTLSSVTSFGSGADKPCVLRTSEPARELHGLWRELGRSLARSGVSMHLGREFAPHVTLGYDKEGLAMRTILPVSWTAPEFALVRSLRGGGTYDVLERFPIGRRTALPAT